MRNRARKYTRNMVRVCRKEGNNNLDVWVQVLTHIVNNASAPYPGDTAKSSLPGDGTPTSPGKTSDHGHVEDLTSDEEEGKEVGEGAWDDVRELLSIIEREQVLPPLQVEF